MLCDDIIAHGITSEMFDRKKMPAVIDRIAKAHKFKISTEFAQVADELVGDLRQVVKALPFCRLPYPEVWIEVNHRDRTHFVNGAPLQSHQEHPRRIGYLLTATSDKLDKWTGHLFWDFYDDSRQAASIAVKFDMQGGYKTSIPSTTDKSSREWRKLNVEEQTALTNIVQPTRPDYDIMIPPIAMMNDLTTKEFATKIVELGQKDWAGEAAYIEAVLALINAKNASEIEYIDKAEHNRKRARKGQRPLSSHHILKIHPRQLARVKESRSSGHHDLRSHFVRGHWKVRKTGIFFWLPFIRGNQVHGKPTQKVYEVA